MARLESVQAKGFYPLDSMVARMIARKIRAEPGATLFDPCAGKGDAVKAIAESCHIPMESVYACELDVHRSNDLEKNLPGANVFKAVDFLGAFHRGKASITYVNPPFDDELGGGGRVEWHFLDRAIDCTMTDGLVVAVLPHSTAAHYQTRDILSTRLTDLVAFDPPEDRRPFEEVIIFGRKLKQKIPRCLANINAIYREYPSFDPYGVDAGDQVVVRKVEYTDQELSKLLDSSAANKLFEYEPVQESRKVLRPPMEMRKGHRAMLLASGFMDGVVDIGDGNPHVVRGSSIKKTETKEEEVDGKIRTTESERIYLVVKVATKDGRVVSLSDSIKDDEGDEESIEGSEQEMEVAHV